MSEVEYCCFIGGLSWSTTDRGLRDAFEKFGDLTDARVVKDKFSGRSRGFGFVTYSDQKAMEEAIEAMNGMDLDGRAIMVDKAQPQASGRDRDMEMVTTVLIAMEITTVDGLEIQVAVAGLEMTDTVATALAHTTDLVEAPDLDRI
ncbi:hypothetical protein Taro_029666, partial [Colocasia esculenta]|nr:hypothetical protein [Colocasia esculenta]